MLSDEEWVACEEMGILVDQDDQGVLMQVSRYTQPPDLGSIAGNHALG